MPSIIRKEQVKNTQNIFFFIKVPDASQRSPSLRTLRASVWPLTPGSPPKPPQFPTNRQAGKFLCVLVFMQLAGAPSAQQIIGPNHCRSSGCGTCHMTLVRAKTSAIAAATRSTSPAADAHGTPASRKRRCGAALRGGMSCQTAPTPPLCVGRHHPLPAMALTRLEWVQARL